MELPVQQFRTKGEQGFLDMFEAAAGALPGAHDSFVSSLRRNAIEAYGRVGLPHRRIEAWKYTDLRSRLTDAYPLLSPTGVAIGEVELSKALGSDFAALPAYRLVIVEGDLRADLSDLSGLKAASVEVVSLAQALEKPPAWLKKTLGQVNPREDDPAVALNTAGLDDESAAAAVAEAARETRLPTADPVRDGADSLLDGVLAVTG